MDTNRRHILLADDDGDDLSLFSEVFLELDATADILAVNTGHKALRALLDQDTDRAFDLIILDYNMPDMTGAAVLKAISPDQRFAQVPKIVWSTSNASLYEALCLHNGANYFFQKPDNIDSVIDLCRRMLALKV